MVGLADLPPELLDLIVLYHRPYDESTGKLDIPVKRFLRDPDSPYLSQYGWSSDESFEDFIHAIMIPVRLSHVNRRLRAHFLKRLWSRLNFENVWEIRHLEQCLAIFSEQEKRGYLGLVETVWFSWALSTHQPRMDREFYIESGPEKGDDFFGLERDWRFTDRRLTEKWLNVPFLRESEPGRTDEEYLAMVSEDAYAGYSSGPDGHGPVPGFNCVEDVIDGMERLLSQCSNLRTLFWSTRLTTIPESFTRLAPTLEALYIAHAWNLGALARCMSSIRHLGLLYHMDPDEARGNLDVEGIDIVEYDAGSPCGVRLKGLTPENSVQRRIYDSLDAVFSGLRSRLVSLIIYDVKLLQIKMLLPVWLALELRRDKELGCKVGTAWPLYDWDNYFWELDETYLDALDELRVRLEACGSVDEVREVSEGFKGGKEARELAGWLVESPQLCLGAFKAIQLRRERSLGPTSGTQ